jgi:DNA replication licensing factor MCM2
LIDVARPGEEVEVTGIYEHSYDAQMTIKSGFPVFSTFITANHVQKKEDASSSSSLTEADLAKIMELSRDPKIGERIVQSMAPSIFGHDNCKMALAMALFGGVPKNINDKHRIRGDCNVLLLGDPGTAKSQLLKYAEYTAPRAVYSTGKGASAVGLTASVHKDPLTKEWTLEGGALVLADRGVCLIDEFDKMNEQDRTSIHEAMEQQSISVSKAGIVTSLQARCAVIAAANPIGGRYDSANTLAENVELTDPILQRFDILCVLQDVVDPVADERLAKFVTSSHMRSTPTSELRRETARQSSSVATQQTTSPDLIPQDLLRKYIQYARTHVKPVLRGNAFDQEKIASLYVQLRKESAASGGVPIAVRHVESIMRMAEAHAKMHLRDYVRDDDMDASIHMMLESFLAAQKFSVRRSLRKSFSKFLRTGDDRAHLLLHMLQEMFRNEQMYQVIRMKEKGGEIENLKVPLDELESRARERRIYDVSGFCKSEAFQEAGYVLDERKRVIVRSYESTSN